jgi:CelD/BcsL family acetyltransferase involved in cellulose biosynthesis
MFVLGDYQVTVESFDALTSSWIKLCHSAKGSIFTLPGWLKAWWREFKPDATLYLCAVRERGNVIGIAPLQVKDEKASFIGSTNVCDHLDFVIAPGREQDFFKVLAPDLKQKGIGYLDLKPVRSDSTVVTDLVSIARDRGCEISSTLEDVSLEIELPPTWDGYLQILTPKQRHEIRRKLRRLWERGDINYRLIEGSEEVMETFLDLFRKSRSDKAAFMTSQMESFFKSLAKALDKLLKFGSLELNGLPVAMVMCFDFEDTMHLYNSGYDPRYSHLSVGLLSKVLCIKDSIERGRKKFDFLKGGEVYKYRLGGKEIPLYNCQIALK